MALADNPQLSADWAIQSERESKQLHFFPLRFVSDEISRRDQERRRFSLFPLSFPVPPFFARRKIPPRSIAEDPLLVE